jgi:hypothetical protein
MTHIKALAHMIIRILTHILVWVEHRLYSLFRLLEKARNAVGVVEDEMTPTWQETMFPLCAAIVGVLAIYVLLAVGGD